MSEHELEMNQSPGRNLVLDGFYFTCGSSLQDLDLTSPLNEVYIRSVKCFEPVEKLYYLAGYDSTCIYCEGNVELCNDSTSVCSKPKITKH